jgi:ethanolamine utilization protein EutN
VILGLVRGTVYGTIQHPFYRARRMLLVDLLNPDGSDTGDYLIAVDSVDAGVGDRVLVLDEGNSARQIVGVPDAPLRSIVVGIVDSVDES